MCLLRYSSLWLILVCASCGSYKKNIMFRLPEGHELTTALTAAESNYVIRQGDYLSLEVYTMNGERIIDPDFELSKELTPQGQSLRPDVHYLVDRSGTVRLPMIGVTKVEGLTLHEAERVLQEAFNTYYSSPYIILKYLNKRVVVLGAPGGQVIPLTDEGIKLTEVLALAQGIDNNARADNIRVLRGDQVFVADLSTIEGYRRNDLAIEAGDIIYIEPIRRPFSEGLRDYGPLLSVVTSLVTLVVVITGL